MRVLFDMAFYRHGSIKTPKLIADRYETYTERFNECHISLPAKLILLT